MMGILPGTSTQYQNCKLIWIKNSCFRIIKKIELCECDLHRGSYISAHVLLNLLNKLRKIDSILGSTVRAFYHFSISYNKFIDTRALMFDSVYDMIQKLY